MDFPANTALSRHWDEQGSVHKITEVSRSCVGFPPIQAFMCSVYREPHGMTGKARGAAPSFAFIFIVHMWRNPGAALGECGQCSCTMRRASRALEQAPPLLLQWKVRGGVCVPDFGITQILYYYGTLSWAKIGHPPPSPCAMLGFGKEILEPYRLPARALPSPPT